MKTIIGVMGPGDAKKPELRAAYKIGQIIARSGSILLSGGMTGVMEESCRGARKAGGLVLAISPGTEKTALNKYVDIPVLTGMRGGRNYVNILSSDVVIAISVSSSGTLSEVAFALQLERPLIILGGQKSMKTYIKSLKGGQVHFVSTPAGVKSVLARILRAQKRQKISK